MTSGSWISGGKLKRGLQGIISPFHPPPNPQPLPPHMSLLACSLFSQTLLLSIPCKGTGLVWQRLIATIGCITLLHCHTSLQNWYLLPPHRCAASASFLRACKHGSAHSSYLGLNTGIEESVDFNVDLWTDEEVVRKTRYIQSEQMRQLHIYVYMYI